MKGSCTSRGARILDDSFFINLGARVDISFLSPLLLQTSPDQTAMLSRKTQPEIPSLSIPGVK